LDEFSKDEMDALCRVHHFRLPMEDLEELVETEHVATHDAPKSSDDNSFGDGAQIDVAKEELWVETCHHW
jgi:hypothetical protein